MSEIGLTNKPQGRYYFKRSLCVKMLTPLDWTEFWGRACSVVWGLFLVLEMYMQLFLDMS